MKEERGVVFFFISCGDVLRFFYGIGSFNRVRLSLEIFDLIGSGSGQGLV